MLLFLQHISAKQHLYIGKNLKPHMREFRIDAFACLYPLASSSENYADADGRFYDEADLGFKAD